MATLTVNQADLVFILQQIKISEAHAAGESLYDLVGNPLLPWGLRTVDGSYNNLVAGQTEFGAADNSFLRLLDAQYRAAYAASGNVVDPQPRIISNLIVDQTANNPAAVAAAAGVDGAGLVSGTRADGITEFETFFIPNTAPDEGLSAPFNAWMTFFGQFFDHGLDLVTKGGSGTVFIPLQPDDPLYVEGGSTNFMVVTRASVEVDAVFHTVDFIRETDRAPIIRWQLSADALARDPARLEVIEIFLVDTADRGAVRTLDVVGVNL